MNETGAPLDQQWRADTYRLLANLLSSPPSKALLLRLSGLTAHKSTTKTDSLPALWVALADAAEQVTVESVRDEYNELFVGMTRGELLPYASWYLTGFLMEKPLAVLREDLRRIGIQRQANSVEPEDHAAAVLEVMSILIEIGDDRQRIFFDRHIKPWMDRFFSDLDKAGSAKFYRSVAQLGAAFMFSEQTALVDLAQ